MKVAEVDGIHKRIAEPASHVDSPNHEIAAAVEIEDWVPMIANRSSAGRTGPQ